MGLENPLYLDQFVSGNPDSQDQRHEGDDHIRNIKTALKNTFPGLGGRIWRKRSISASGPVGLADNMTVLDVGGGLTITPAAASVLGNGWMAFVRANDGSVTINPAEPINGDSSMVVPVGYICILFCDGTEFFTMLAYENVPQSVPVFPSGTKMVFNQTTPPIGWTKLSTAAYNNAGVRMTTGTVGSGGSDDFSTTFGVGKSTLGFSLSSSHNGPHTHPANHSHAANSKGNDSTDSSGSVVGGGDTGSSGSGTAHAHSLSGLNLRYIDLIAASKD